MSDASRLREHAQKLRQDCQRMSATLRTATAPFDPGDMPEVLDRAADRIALIERWLESRGLPVGWVGPLDAWGWVEVRKLPGSDDLTVRGYRVTNIDIRGVASCGQNWEHTDSSIRWDRATDAQKAEALRLEKERG